MYVFKCENKVIVHKSRCEMVCEGMDEYCSESTEFKMSHLGNYCAHLTADSALSNGPNEWEQCLMTQLY